MSMTDLPATPLIAKGGPWLNESRPLSGEEYTQGWEGEKTLRNEEVVGIEEMMYVVVVLG